MFSPQSFVIRYSALLLLALASAHAAPPLTADIRPLALRARTLAPETYDVKLTWSGNSLLEGALELTFPSGDESAPKLRSGDLALTNGTKSFRLLVPASSQNAVVFSREVRAQFVTKAGVLDLGRFDFGARPGTERAFSICVSKAPLGGAAKDATLWQSVRLDRFRPEDATYKAMPSTTLPVFVDTEEMPATALGYTSYDIVLLEGEGFTLLRDKHLAALTRWVLAGGSLCVKTNGPLEANHRHFLAELLAADGRGLAPAFGEDGSLDQKGNGSVLLTRPGLGRLVVASPGPQSEVDMSAEWWKRAGLFLWKVHGVQREGALPAEPWRWEPNDRDPRRANQAQQYLSSLLTPKQVRLVPYSLVLLLLGGFVLVIGPLDWWVLGCLRLRRLTWITFPLAAAAFTALTVSLAESYMGRNNYHSALTVTDLGTDGRVLRETRFEMIFPARNQEVATDVHNALCVPMNAAAQYYQPRPVAPGRYAGSFPARYTMRQSLSQWTPQVNRLTSLEAGDDTSGLPWSQLHPRDINAANSLQRSGGDRKWEIYAVRGGVFGVVSGGTILREMVGALGKSKESGWPNICAHFSPNGAADLEDLALGAENDPDLFATIAAHPEGDGFHIYRHLYAP